MKKRAHSKLLMGNRWPQIPQLLVEIVHHCPISRCKGVWKIRHGWGNREKKHQNLQSTGTSEGCCLSPKRIFKTLVQEKLTPNRSLIRGISHDFPSTSIEDNQISIREVSPSPQLSQFAEELSRFLASTIWALHLWSAVGPTVILNPARPRRSCGCYHFRLDLKKHQAKSPSLATWNWLAGYAR